MFCAFASVLVIQFRNIQERIRSASSSETDINDLLKKLNRQLFTVCEAVSELANYFSIILLPFVSFIFVQAVIFSHLTFCVISGQESRSVYKTILLFLYIFRLFFILNAICYKADEIKNEVSISNTQFAILHKVTFNFPFGIHV